ncbi:hypothetical protein GGF31_008115 [Allomyces arbusculus]|nr:hypothetical protein GGF31_008115 [Allomyces arbusculus]
MARLLAPQLASPTAWPVDPLLVAQNEDEMAQGALQAVLVKADEATAKAQAA